MYVPAQRARRVAFTLIELLVVIVIIALLAALTTAGVMVIFNKGPEVQANSEKLQLDMALKNFYNDHKVYPPSKIRLCKTQAEYAASPTPYDAESIQFIRRIWPRLNWANVDWAGTMKATGTYTPLPATGVILEGDQCLVFFLGGIPNLSTPSCWGFSADVTNPANLGVGATPGAGGKVKSYFEFDTTRLYARTNEMDAPFTAYNVNGTPGAAFKFYSLKDPFGGGMPYVYFSSGMKKNDYRDHHAIKITSTAGTTLVAPYFSSDLTAPRLYYNPTTFQIITAGAGGVFGPGGRWRPEMADGMDPEWRDDLTNFETRRLGDAQP